MPNGLLNEMSTDKAEVFQSTGLLAMTTLGMFLLVRSTLYAEQKIRPLNRYEFAIYGNTWTITDRISRHNFYII